MLSCQPLDTSPLKRTTLPKIAALFVLPDGPYSRIPNVECWDKERDALNYAGPYPVVAHPPCNRWGLFWAGNPLQERKRDLGDDEGCFDSALAGVRRFGGVLEHPFTSYAFNEFGLRKPKALTGVWEPAGDWQGFVCYLEQGSYGNETRKPTILYANEGCDLSIITPTSIKGANRLASGKRDAWEKTNKTSRMATPETLRNLLVELARSYK